MRINTALNILKSLLFLVFAFADIEFLNNRSPKSLHLAKNGNYSILPSIFVTIATVKVKLISEFYTWVIPVIKQLDKICEKQLSVFGSRGGRICPLMQVSRCLWWWPNLVCWRYIVELSYFLYLNRIVSFMSVKCHFYRPRNRWTSNRI